MALSSDLILAEADTLLTLRLPWWTTRLIPWEMLRNSVKQNPTKGRGSHGIYPPSTGQEQLLGRVSLQLVLHVAK